MRFSVFLLAMVLIFVAYFDFRWRRIPNYLTFPLLIAGLLVNTVVTGGAGIRSALLGVVVGGGLFAVLHFFKWMGAGDVKFVAAVGAWLGIEHIFIALFYTIMIGGGMAIAQLGFHALSRKHKSQDDTTKNIYQSSTKKIQTPLLRLTIPYGVAIAIGTLVAVVRIL